MVVQLWGLEPRKTHISIKTVEFDIIIAHCYLQKCHLHVQTDNRKDNKDNR